MDGQLGCKSKQRRPLSFYWSDSAGCQGWYGLALVSAGSMLFGLVAGGQVISDASTFSILSIIL